MYDLCAPSIFGHQLTIPDDCDVIFVSDLFVEDYPYGGAELTSEALITSSPFRIFKLHSKDVTLKLLEEGASKYWIFGNFASMDFNLIPSIIANLKYSVIEYDYKFCRWRSLDKHQSVESKPCDCHNDIRGKVISAFYYGARSLWWMSERQQSIYHDRFSCLCDRPTTVLSSVFDEDTFTTIASLRKQYDHVQRTGWIVLGSTSWIKGTDQAIEWCNENGKQYEVVQDIPYIQLLQKLSKAEGLVYLPQGGDTCPRLVIEAKLLGCALQLNENVQHASEEWFSDFDTMMSYLYMARSRFWNGIHSDMGEDVTTISGYTTTYNCITNDYPYVESIMSMVAFCDQVVVVDSGSTDGTWEQLEQLAADHNNILIYRRDRDRSSTRWAINFDGRQKALARSLCTSAFCWQQDSDEIVHEDDIEKIKHLVKYFPKDVMLLALPVVEYWGSTGKVRCDIHNWKWRLSRNAPGLTHGIPNELRRYDEHGQLYAAQGTDSCDPIWLNDYSRVKFMNFYTEDIDALRRRAVEGNVDALREYNDWYNNVIKNLPAVYHYSWFNIERKIHSYKTYWSTFWSSLYNMSRADTAENNMFFDKPWSDVSDDDIEAMATRLEDEMGGWIFHRKVNFDVKVPAISVNVKHPLLMDDWIDRNTFDIVDDQAHV